MPAVAMQSRFEQAQPVYRNKIRSFAKKNFRILPSTEPEDLEQELLDVLWLACESYDPDRGAKFNTHFWNCAQRRLLDLHKAASRQKRVGDYERVWLDETATQRVIEDEYLNPSTEDEYIATINVREILRARYETE